MTQIELPIIRQSERGDFKMCPAKWNWRWNEWLVPRNPRQDARWFGTIWHLLWASVYTPPAGKDGFTRSITRPEEIHALWDELTQDSYVKISGAPFWGDDQEREFTDARELGHIMIDGQMREWNLDPGWEILMPETRFRMLIKYSEDQLDRLGDYVDENLGWRNNIVGDHEKYIAQLVGTYDIPVRDHNNPGTPKPMIVDWKSIARRESLKQMNKDDQTGSYMISATAVMRAKGFIGPNESVNYMVYSYARKAKPPEETKMVDSEGRVRNKPNKNHYILAINKATGEETVTEKDSLKIMEKMSRELGLTVFGAISKNQGSPLFWREVFRRNDANKARQKERIAEEAEIMGFIRGGELPIIKAPGDHCNWGCDYSDLCDIDEDGGDTESYIKDMFVKEDPYADHRPGARNSKESVLDGK